ncbi:ATPase [Deinococcus indicus]|uniref:ATPase n=1 Tax=Deinococcus indicus TaxID=223556 RepID=A0A246BJZ5_9DEIO|nr:AAA family ATPase [Deinococcus indicus]OWL95625.1 ATPase [Deinococcus indicus]
MTIDLNPAFTIEEKFFLGGLKRRLQIPAHLCSPRGPTGSRYYGAGIGYAAGLLMTDQASLETDGQSVRVTYPSSGKAGGTRTVMSAASAAGRTWWSTGSGGLNSATAPFMLLLAEALVLRAHEETLSALLQLAEKTAGLMSESTFRGLPAQDASVREAVLRLSDYAYFELKEKLLTNEITEGAFTPGPLKPVSTSRLNQLLLNARVVAPTNTTPLSRLRRLARRGGSALLVGPPGTFKTETVKQLVLDVGAAVVKMRGAPGVEDRDFIGAVTPGVNGPEWVDGPLARAFMLAKDGLTVIQIDEILRYHAEHLQVLVGAMDELSFEDARAVLQAPLERQGQTPDQVTAAVQATLPDPNTRYYLLDLPTGDAIFCPKKNLVWALTTNMGEDHLQTAQNLDSALLSRIDLVIDYERPEADVVLPIYEAVAGDSRLARLGYDLEDLTYSISSDSEGLLVRPMDARKTIALLKEARACLEDGLSMREAILEAAFVTAVPHCCPRDARGLIEPASRQNLLKRIEEEVLSAA